MVKIFIAEDDPLMVRLYAKAFQLAGYKVETAFDGEEAITKLQTMKVKPTLILLDIMMSKINGLDVLRQIKRDASLKKIPVVILSNLTDEEEVKKALELGAVLYLLKSEYDPQQVVDKMKKVIASHNQ